MPPDPHPRPATAAARLVLVHAADPEALFADAAAPFCAPAPAGPAPNAALPLLALRQGGLRDLLQERAAAAGCPGWLGRPAVVFAELPELLAGDLAPLSRAERRALLGRVARETRLTRLGPALAHRGVLDTVDALFGDLAAERVHPARVAELADTAEGAWEAARDRDLAALYAAYLAAVAALPPRDGVPRNDGRDGITLAADALRADPDAARRRLRRPLGDPDAPLAVRLYGLNDLRRGWDLLLDALLGAPFVDEVRVYVPLDRVDAAERAELDALAEWALADALLARGARVEAAAAADPGPLGAVRGALFRGAAPVEAPRVPAVRAVAAPDAARELDRVARRVKQLVVEAGVAPHRIAVVSRKARPYGPRAADALARHGVPVTTRQRTALAEVPAVAALVRVFRAAAEGYPWRALADLAASPYFTLDLDAGLLRRAGARGAHRTLAEWGAALEGVLAEARRAEASGDEGGAAPGVERARRAAAAFARFRDEADGFAAARPLGDWIALALRCVGRDAGGGRAAGVREGLWGLCRNACRPPHDDADPMAVDAARRDAEGLALFGDLLVEWRAALALAGDGAAERVTAPDAWLAALAAELDDAELALATPHRRGVQVLEASAAVWRPVDHLFVVGMAAGAFPAEPGGRELLGEADRERWRAAGLPVETAAAWFAREASLLRLVAGGARRTLHVSYAYADAAGAAEIASAYFDEVAARAGAAVETIPGSALAPASLDDVWCADDLALFAASAADRPDGREAYAQLAADPASRALVERVLAAAGQAHERAALAAATLGRRVDAARPWNGAVTSPDLLAALGERFGDGAVWSVTQLEAYGRCPFAFFAGHVLGLADDAPAADDESDAATRGSMLHACLARLHASLAAELGDEALTQRAVRRGEQLIPAAVDRVVGEFEKSGRGGPAALRALRRRELVALLTEYLQFEVAENEKDRRRTVPPRRPLATEVAFGMRGLPPAVLRRDGRVLRLRGSVDRVDVITGGDAAGMRYVVDHKTSGASVTPAEATYEAGVNLQLPLYMHALAALEPDARVWGGAYQVARAGGCERVSPLHPHDRKKDGAPTAKADTERQRHAGALEWAFLHADAVRRGEFPARLPERTAARGCPPYCAARDVCRADVAGTGGARR